CLLHNCYLDQALHAPCNFTARIFHPDFQLFCQSRIAYCSKSWPKGTDLFFQQINISSGSQAHHLKVFILTYNIQSLGPNRAGGPQYCDLCHNFIPFICSTKYRTNSSGIFFLSASYQYFSQEINKRRRKDHAVEPVQDSSMAWDQRSIIFYAFISLYSRS